MPPAITIAPLVVVQAAFLVRGRPTYGFLGHFLEQKVDAGVHLDALLSGLWDNSGPALFALLCLGFVTAWIMPARPGRGWVFLAWFLAFAVPVTFLINPAGTVTRAYLTPVALPLLVLGGAGLIGGVAHGEIWLGRVPARMAGAAAVAATFVVAAAMLPPRVYEWPVASFPVRPIGLWGGEIYGNDGVKAAGYWIRKHTPSNAVVLSDVRLFIGKYYFHRPTIPPGDARFTPDGFRRVRERVHALALTGGFRATAAAAGYLEGYDLAATVTHRGRPVFYVYARGAGPSITLPAEAVDPAFDREFGRIEALRYPVIWKDDLPSGGPGT